MKKIFLLFLLVLVSVTASARKSYITVSTYNNNGKVLPNSANITLTGEVPDNIEGFEYSSKYQCWFDYSNGTDRTYSVGEILNVLSEYGYEVEFVDNDFHCFLLSKETPSGQTISKGDVNEDSEVNIADVNEVISLILGIVREHPEILKQIKD